VLRSIRQPIPHPSLRLKVAAFWLGLIAWLALLAGPVAAHAELVTADPAPNASLIDSPEAVRMTFSERIDPSSVSVDLLDAARRRVAGVGEPRVDESETGVAVDMPLLEQGTYTVSYRVLSAVDGHATVGRFSFAVDPSGALAPPASDPFSASPSVDAWSIAARWIALVSALVALGSLILWWTSAHGVLAVLASRAPQLSTRPPWSVIAATSAASFVGLWLYLILAARPLGTPDDQVGATLGWLDPAAPFGWSPFAIAMRVALGGCLLATLASVALSVRAVRPRADAAAIAVAAALLALALGAMSAAGHASSLGGPLNVAIDWVHLLAAAAWLGGLPAAYVLARRAASVVGSVRTALTSILLRHGRVALVAAPVVILTGLANSPLVLGRARELVASPHGNLLLAKALLASLAIGIGAANHLLLRGRGRANLALLVTAEMGVAAVAVVAAAAMVTVQPGAARQPPVMASLVRPAHLFGEAGPSRVHVVINLPSPGNQSYQAIVRDLVTGAPRPDVQRVFLAFEPPAGSGLATERVTLEARGADGIYVAQGAHTPVVGDWRVETTVRRTGARDETVAFTVPIRQDSPATPGPTPDLGLGVPAPVAVLWALLPPGLLGWVPGVLGLLAVLVLGRGRITSGRLMPLKAGAVVLATVAVLAAGSRTVVEVANRPASGELAVFDASADHGSSERGERIYLANCASCHGVDGDGHGPVTTLPPAGSLPAVLRTMSDSEVSYRIANGLAGTAMPPFAASLTAEERRDLVTYLRERWGGAARGTRSNAGGGTP
jgi:copper transport protein